MMSYTVFCIFKPQNCLILGFMFTGEDCDAEVVIFGKEKISAYPSKLTNA